MFHDVHIEWGLNAKAYFEAYRGLCRIRYEYAVSRIVEDEEHWDHKTIDCPAHKRITFWTKVAEYWKKKLAESYKREDEYFGH